MALLFFFAFTILTALQQDTFSFTLHNLVTRPTTGSSSSQQFLIPSRLKLYAIIKTLNVSYATDRFTQTRIKEITFWGLHN
jgi:hypothetical protein